MNPLYRHYAEYDAEAKFGTDLVSSSLSDGTFQFCGLVVIKFCASSCARTKFSVRKMTTVGLLRP